MSAYDCPNCKSRNTQKVSIMLQENVTSYGGNVRAHNMLAQSAVGDIPQKKDEEWGGGIFFCVAGYFFLDYVEVIGWIGIALGVILLWMSYDYHNYNVNEYPVLMEEFNSKYICKRCGCVFNVHDR